MTLSACTWRREKDVIKTLKQIHYVIIIIFLYEHEVMKLVPGTQRWTSGCSATQIRFLSLTTHDAENPHWRLGSVHFSLQRLVLLGGWAVWRMGGWIVRLVVGGVWNSRWCWGSVVFPAAHRQRVGREEAGMVFHLPEDIQKKLSNSTFSYTVSLKDEVCASLTSSQVLWLSDGTSLLFPSE